jgi:hypothetical protein
MEIDPENARFSRLQTWVASDEARRLDEQVNDKREGEGNGMWDDNGNFISQLGGRILTSSDVNLAVSATEPGYIVELAIPKTERANLVLEDGNTIGYHIDYEDISNEGIGAYTYDQWSYVYMNFSGLKATDVEPGQQAAHTFDLQSNYPNPFNPRTVIEYSVGQTAEVTLKVYNMLGREVATLVDEQKNAGAYKVQFDARNLSSGIYFYRLQAGNKSQVQKMTLIK